MCPVTNFIYTLIKLMTNLLNKFYIEQQTNKTKIKESAFDFFQDMNSVRSNNLSLKYQRFTPYPVETIYQKI